MSIKLISIVLPVYNQADHIEILMDDYLQVVQKVPIPCEFILVVNNSSDRSLDVCNKIAGIYHPSVNVIHTQQGGWGLAVRLGIQKARGDLICYTNSARTRSSDLLLFLLYGFANPNVVIKANRKFRDNWRRRLGSLIYNIQIRSLFDLPYWDINGTPKIFPRTFEKLLLLQEDGDLIDAEFDVICRQQDYPLLEVPIVAIKRRGGKSTTNYASALRMYLGAFRLWKRIGKQVK